MDKHALSRTSPKGPGQKFIGTCMKCGKQNLSLADVGRDECINPAGLTGAETLTLAVKAPWKE